MSTKNEIDPFAEYGNNWLAYCEIFDESSRSIADFKNRFLGQWDNIAAWAYDRLVENGDLCILDTDQFRYLIPYFDLDLWAEEQDIYVVTRPFGVIIFDAG